MLAHTRGSCARSTAWLVAAATALVACPGAPPNEALHPAPPSPAPLAATGGTPDYVAPSFDVASGPVEEVCRAEPETGEAFDYGFEFGEPIPIYAVAFGPRVAEMPIGAPRRTAKELYSALVAQARYLSACYAWARAAEPLEAVRERARFTIDPFGIVREVEVKGGGERLEGCVAEGLRNVQLDYLTARVTKVDITLAFVPTDLGRPATPPARPTPAPPGASPPKCMTRQGPLPVDELGVGDQVFATFDDWTHERAQAEYRRKHPTRPPTFHAGGCLGVSSRIRPEDVRRAVMSNRGALQSCYAEALARTPGLVGTLRVHAAFRRSLRAERVDVDGPGGSELAACVTAALKEVRLPHLRHGVELDTAFQFALSAAPALPAAPLSRGQVQIEIGDSAGALASFAQVIRSSGGELGCRARLGVVEAALARAPWVDDPRVWSAIEAFDAYADGVRGDAAVAACLARADEVIAAVVTWPFEVTTSGVLSVQDIGRFGTSVPGRAVRTHVVERLERALAKHRVFPGDGAAREFIALDRLARGRIDEGIAMFAELLAPGGGAKPITSWLKTLTTFAARDASDSLYRAWVYPEWTEALGATPLNPGSDLLCSLMPRD